MKIVLLISNPKNRQLLHDVIVRQAPEAEVVNKLPGTGAEIDLIVCCGTRFARHHEEVARLKRESAPLLLQCLLLLPRSSANGDRQVPEGDDLLLLPVSRQELTVRLRQLLHARTMSLQLQESHVASLEESNRQLTEAVRRLKETQQQIIEQERLRALGEMASGIAHDFNNQLSIITGYCQLMLLQLARGNNLDIAKLTGKLERIAQASDDAARIVSRLRKFYRARDESDGFRVLDLNGVVLECVELTRPKWQRQAHKEGAHIEVETDLGPEARVLGDEQELREVLINLIGNATDAMPKGGTLRLCTRTGERGEVHLQVADTGIGMTESVRARCLDTFFTTKGEGGTGLGLSITKGALERHGAEIAVESVVDAGTCFRICFPRPEKGETSSASADDDVVTVAPQRILLVDDEEGTREVIQRLLEMDGHTVTAAPSGAAALELLEAEPITFVMTDLAMPGMTGAELATAIRAAYPEVPVALLTGFGNLMDATQDLPDGANALIAKPANIQALRRGIVKALRRHGAARTA